MMSKEVGPGGSTTGATSTELAAHLHTNNPIGSSHDPAGLGIPDPNPVTGLLDAALWWLERGMTVIPLRRGDNRPHQMLGSGWTRESVGTRDPDKARAWWAQDKLANIGVVPAMSGVVVVDCDRRPDRDGERAFTEWADDNGVRVNTPGVTATPSGGTHYWFRWPADQPVPGHVVGWLHGVDVPWQVAVPPSHRLVVDGLWVPYRWVKGDPALLPAAPGELVDAIRQGGRHGALGETGEWSSVPVDVEAYTRDGLGIVSGSRDVDCTSLAGKLWVLHQGDVHAVVTMVRRAWEATPPGHSEFSWSQAMKCVHSVQRRAQTQAQADRTLVTALKAGWRP